MSRTLISEIHLDAREISPGLKNRLLDLGFVDDDFLMAGGGLELPPIHLTWQREGPVRPVREAHSRVLCEVRELLGSSGNAFVGYLESEQIPEGNQISFERAPFDCSRVFPLGQIPQISSRQNKRSDLHIKVPLDLLDPDLERIMDDCGIYFVETPKGNRIYTLQFLNHADGKAAFLLFADFFSEAGGCTELTYEVCDAFARYPAHIDAPTVVQPGFFAAA
ncbi:MAG: hypothetical protein HKN82_02635 [Akkermansiaceae bacterium]|nr:hypothetical protein [Akkermansiaceae bacterium]